MTPFIVRVVLSFIIGGSYAASVIWISEKFGSKVGGILTGIPTTVFIGLTFIALTAGQEAAHKAALIIPAMVGVSLILVYTFTRLLHLGSERALVVATLVWFLFANLFVRLHLTNLAVNIVIGSTLLLLAKFATSKYPRNLRGSAKVLRRTYIVRVIGAGIVIASAVVIARLAGPIWGGVFSAFPATFASTLYMLSKAQGPDFAKSVARQLPLANGATLSFAVVFYLLILHSGLFVSVTLAALASVIYAGSLLAFSRR